ncbi:hypothetical protein HEQ63_07115 [Haematospirillum jordaniae]|uniref:3TM-type holin n=1 Tax=Haematospirillum jordaniae TaxID=1549855 RepID=UPI0014333A9E|nr:3TM-type holin [Haematospirillum jordaniae]NKD85951.1 hypothetical protein [Haematospirillum jordaniae]
MEETKSAVTVSGLVKHLTQMTKQTPPSRQHHKIPTHHPISAWDRGIDNLNRLPRPLMALGVIALMAWPAINPRTFAEAMQSYAMMPDWLVQLVMAVVLAYFVSRTVEKIREKSSASATSSARVAASTEDTERAPVIGRSATRKIPESQA